MSSLKLELQLHITAYSNERKKLSQVELKFTFGSYAFIKYPFILVNWTVAQKITSKFSTFHILRWLWVLLLLTSHHILESDTIHLLPTPLPTIVQCSKNGGTKFYRIFRRRNFSRWCEFEFESEPVSNLIQFIILVRVVKIKNKQW